ncbi:hypothetical protein MS3_00002437, partial [Schistosoma haematobium]
IHEASFNRMLRFSLLLIHCLSIVLVQSRFNSTIEYFDENLSDKNKWAILVAGSNGFYNYRHQADVCHAYHVLRSKGIKPEHIITMMYDDIAHNKMNPFRGKIFNDYSHRDWYKGVVIDYKGKKVNSETFLKVLKGDQSAGGKVLKSGKNDDVFIYFTDHGAPGLIAFPDDENMGKLHVGEFQGSRNKDSPENDEPPMKPKDFVASRDIPLHTLRRQIMMTNNGEDKNLLIEILGLKLKRRDFIEDTMKLVVKVMNNENKPIAKATIDQTLDCTESVYEQFKSKCFTLQQAPEVGGHLSTLYNYCAEGYTAETINEAIIKICN